MTTLREWLDRLEEYDPDDWGQINELRAKLSEGELDTDLEAEITFRTEGGQVDHVDIQLLDFNEHAVVELDYDIFQLDTVILTEFIRDAVFSKAADPDPGAPS